MTEVPGEEDITIERDRERQRKLFPELGKC